MALLPCLRWAAVCACLLVAATAANAQEAYNMAFSVRAKGSIDIELPRMIGADGEVLLGSVDGSCLQYGVL